MSEHKHRVKFTIQELETIIKEHKEKHAWLIGQYKECEDCYTKILIEVEDCG